MPQSERTRPRRLRLVAAVAEATPESGTTRVARGADSESRLAADAELVAESRHRAGAFESLYRRHAGFAFNLAVRIQGNAHDVEDIVHDAFVRAHERLEELRDAAAFRAWLGSIVVRLVRTRLRRKRLLTTLGLSSPEPVELDSLASSDAGPEARALLQQVYGVLSTMPADDRIAWTLRHVERHRLEAVAVLADCSLATAKRRIARAQQVLDLHFESGRGGTDDAEALS